MTKICVTVLPVSQHLSANAMGSKYIHNKTRAPPISTSNDQKGNGDVDMPPPDILSFSSAENDAALTFINSTAVNGVIFQHGQAFDVVASDGLLKVILLPDFRFLSEGSDAVPRQTIFIRRIGGIKGTRVVFIQMYFTSNFALHVLVESCTEPRGLWTRAARRQPPRTPTADRICI